MPKCFGGTHAYAHSTWRPEGKTFKSTKENERIFCFCFFSKKREKVQIKRNGVSCLLAPGRAIKAMLLVPTFLIMLSFTFFLV
ncbi:unnamed protein product [Boreogadus saida]